MVLPMWSVLRISNEHGGDVVAKVKCEACGGSFEVPGIPERYLEQYGNVCNLTTPCCGVVVRLFRRLVFGTSLYPGDEAPKEDDWGTPAKAVAPRQRGTERLKKGQ